MRVSYIMQHNNPPQFIIRDAVQCNAPAMLDIVLKFYVPYLSANGL